MYVHEVIIDGFKSYATKTVVSGFDPHFNAITGLNGTGKSNILDAICFVLGISNLSQVRVGNLQELVYKQGQAGITKATVTVIFNNNDAQNSPVGYEASKQISVTRQIVIGGKNKYVINGRTVQQKDVQNLFHSVQLNVNNPHFLIMQGRITKVLNMKPQEILSMIEEAAGTRMFETKKEEALKTIEKKQQKVDQLTNVMEQEINPTLDHLRGDREKYQQFMSNGHELERLDRFCIAYEFRSLENDINSSEAKQTDMKGKLRELEAERKHKQAEAEELQRKLAALRAEVEREAEGGLAVLQLSSDEISKALVKADAVLKNQKEVLHRETGQAASLEKQMTALAQTLKDKSAELAIVEGQYAQREKEYADAEQEVLKLRERYQNACAGIADEQDSELLSIPEQIGAWERKVRETDSQLQQNAIRAEHARKQIAEMSKGSKAEEAEHKKSLVEAESLRSRVAEAEKALAQCEAAAITSLGHADDVSKEFEATKQQRTVSKDAVDGLGAQLAARLAFEYRDPEKGFDRSKVRGMVAKLFTVADPKYATALEITAGGKLFQVVVDSEQTGKQLLDHGQLKKRVTLLPLNKLSSRCIDESKMKLARDMAAKLGGTAHLAMELVSFDGDVRRAMEYTFGGTIVCSSSAVAKAIAFDKSIATKTVTLEGDVYDPSGTLTGGSSSPTASVLGKLHDLTIAEASLAALNKRLNELQTYLQEAESKAGQVKKLSDELQRLRLSLQESNERLEDSNYGRAAQTLRDAEASISAFDKEAAALKQENLKAKQELKQLQETASSASKSRDAVMKKMERDTKVAQKAATELKASMATVKHRRDVLLAETDSASAEMQSSGEQLAVCSKGIAKLQAEVQSLTTEVSQMRVSFAEASAKIKEREEELSRFNKDIRHMESEREKCLKSDADADIAHRKISGDLKEWDRRVKEMGDRIRDLLNTCSWIETEKAYFGQHGSDYDFEAKDPAAVTQRRSILKADQDKLSKTINKKVMTSIEKAESESADLLRKRQVILADKKKIEDVIAELDVKKTQSLEATWVKVNRDFGSIFSTLLPGTTAKLEPLEGKSVMDGLEVKVAFNNVWKDSLTELSGGQRSLLALSLILSLLLFKPAPMYILDEVDAALDLSHTQNIGVMLRAHFSASQFIVVSLKEGMFNNANVIFRTRFVDGVSAVQRTVVGSKAKAIEADAHDDEENESNAVNKASKGAKAKTSRKAAAV